MTNYRNILLWNKDKLIYPRYFRNKQWGEQFGPIQDELRQYSFNKLTIDFVNLIWIDPLPLLSLLVELKLLENIKVILILPKIDSESNQNYLLAFLKTEGFLDEFPKRTEIISDGRIINDTSIYEQYAVELNYSDCSIIKALVININEQINDVNFSTDDWVEELVYRIQSRIKSKVETYKYKEVVDRLRILLSETILNVYEHAYPNSDKKMLGLYVRLRKGLSNTRIHKKEFKSLEKLLKTEESNSPKLKKNFLNEVFSFIEIFVLDSGCGLSNNYFPEAKVRPKHPFREAWRQSMIEKKRGFNSEMSKSKKTQYGGLYYIYRNLGENYICARDENEWIGHETPLNFDPLNFYEEIGTKKMPVESNVKGFSIIYRLTWQIASDSEKYWTKQELFKRNDKYELNTHPYYKEAVKKNDIYSRAYDNKPKSTHYYVEDDRFEFSSRLSKKIYKNESKIETCIFLPSRRFLKNTILEIVEEKFSDIKSNSRCLIICDILVHQANLFQTAIENSEFSEEFVENFDRIILVSERFSFLILQKDPDEKIYVKDIGSYRIINDSKKFYPQYCLEDLIAWIRTHDSYLFWMLVKKKSELNNILYINSEILWFGNEEDYEMDGYLNFAQIESDSDLRKLIEKTLRRTLCLSNKENNYSIRFSNIDILTSQLVSKMNSIFFNQNYVENTQLTPIILGSIYASGLSQNEKQKIFNIKNQIPIHFFIHNALTPDDKENLEFSNHENLAHLFLWPNKWLKDNFPLDKRLYKRVGRSHMIAPYGWKYFTIPRYRIYDTITKNYVRRFSDLKDKTKNEFICAYGSDATESYRDWQVRQHVLEFGHFVYEGKHDLIKIDFPLIISDSFNDGSKLAIFLLSEILMALGLKHNNLTNPIERESGVLFKKFDSNQMFERKFQSLKESIESYINKNPSDECAVIIYPSHFNSNYIVEKVKEYIDSRYHERIFGLVPIHKDRNASSYLVSPLAIEEIRKKINKFKKENKVVNVLIIDDVTVEGKTRKELKHLLFNLGADNVNTLCVVDRRRLPFGTTIPKKHKAFYRLDIPRLGSKGESLISRAIDIIKSVDNNFIYSAHKSRLKSWVLLWDSQFPYTKNKEHGLKSKPLKTEIEKKFGIYIDENTGETVHCDNVKLINSTGILLYSAEIHSMTGRHDMALSLCKNNSLTNLIKISLLSVNLILFSKDFSESIISEMINKLIGFCNLEDECSNESALASIAIISQPLEIIKKEIFPLVFKDDKPRNLDLELLFSICILNDLVKFDNNILLGNFQGTYSKNDKTAYFNLHHEIHNDRGRYHNKAFDQVLSLHEKSLINPEKIDACLASCNRLEAIIRFFPYSNMRGSYSKKDYMKLTSSISELEPLLIKHLDSVTKIDVDKYYDDKKISPRLFNIQKSIEKVSKLVKFFHDKFFTKLGIQLEEEFPIKDELKRVIDSHNSEHNTMVGISSNFIKKVTNVEYEKWVPWDRIIERKIKYILTNARHSKGNKIDEFGKYCGPDSLDKTYDMIVSLEYCENGLNLVFENYSLNSKHEIEIEEFKKTKPERNHLIDLGGNIEYKEANNTDGIFKINTVLFLPFY